MATANIPGTEYTHYGNQSAGRRTLLHYISDLAIRDPHKPAIHQLLAPPNDQSEGQQVILSYRDIAALVDKICWSIHGHGVEINDSSVIAYDLTSR
ncbi:Male sterility NAD-binding [Penicillium verhagenii]|uniref:Male sterility NAD-binding n=1 Tax=Penicillium verhagenii TaxID=1562060 RepID=UPI002545478D|nr:Male sterility NAD-binding [Penicillium verhagenii]KAJ5918434.1 Male sterility NAD-binding [Penicillium verhagenii]